MYYSLYVTLKLRKIKLAFSNTIISKISGNAVLRAKLLILADRTDSVTE